MRHGQTTVSVAGNAGEEDDFSAPPQRGPAPGPAEPARQRAASGRDIADMWRSSTPLTARADLIARLLWVLEVLDYAEPTDSGPYRATARGARALQRH